MCSRTFDNSVMKHILLKLLLVVTFVALAECIESSDFVLDVEEFSAHIQKHLEVFSKDTHPRHPEQRSLAQQYIQRAFEGIGLEVEEQIFTTTVAFSPTNETMIEGKNIIAYSKGSDLKHVMVIGAHYDSVGNTENHYPERDNGVGIATLLEVALAYEGSLRWKGYRANHTTIFVAFDLNTKDQLPQSPGKPGSEIFVTEWLIPKLKVERNTYFGSFILDSIATYNIEENSQNLPADFKQVFPDAYERIVDGDKKGDFIAAVSVGEGSKKVLEDFSGHYNYDRELRPFRLQPLVGNLTATGYGSYATVEMFDDQASFHFWAVDLPSVLLTDTAGQRNLPAGEQANNVNSDLNYVFWYPERQEFVHKTYYALSYTVLDNQATYIGLTDTSSAARSATATLLASAVVVALARLFA